MLAANRRRTNAAANYVGRMRVRSLLFGPASRLDFVPKFVASSADLGVLDLEDATPEAEKRAARDALADAAPGREPLGRMRLLIRTNSIGSPHFVDDVEAAAAAHADGIVVPKLETDREVQDIRAAMASLSFAGAILCGGLESVAGVHRAVEVCGAGLDLAYFGAEDFVTDIGGRRTSGNTEVLYARSRVAMAGRLAGIPVLDQIVADFGDDARFSAEAAEARDLGYAGKMCIHPRQVPLANAAFTPSPEEIDHARGLLAAAAAAEASGSGVASYDGSMVDAPLIERARRLLDSIQPD